MTQYCQYVARTGIKETVVFTLGDHSKLEICPIHII